MADARAARPGYLRSDGHEIIAATLAELLACRDIQALFGVRGIMDEFAFLSNVCVGEAAGIRAIMLISKLAKGRVRIEAETATIV